LRSSPETLDYSQFQSRRIRGKPPGPKRRNLGMNVEITMYGCLLPDFDLTGALRRILAGVPCCGALLRLWIILRGKYMGHQAEPLYLARLNTPGRSPSIPEGAVKDRLTHCHSSLSHGTHTIGLGIVYRGLLLHIRCVLRNRVTTRRMWVFTTHRRSWTERSYNPHLPPLEKS